VCCSITCRQLVLVSMQQLALQLARRAAQVSVLLRLFDGAVLQCYHGD
jgi:hypothetical protein